MILLDTDVVIDLALGREPWVADATALFEELERGPKTAFVAWHTLSNVYYLVTPARGGASVREFLVDLTRLAAVVQTGSEDVRFAASLPMADFEDALQVAAAHSVGATVIATRNVSDYANSPIPALAPAEILEGL